MTTTHKSLVDQYSSVLQSYLEKPDENALDEANELGRTALGDGLGLLEMAAIHHAALAARLKIIRADPDQTKMIRAAKRFFIESLVPFEMSLRGFQEANSALRTSEAMYRDLVENASDIVFSTDLENNFTSVNKAIEQITGYLPEEILKLNFAQLVAPEYQGTLREMLTREPSRDEASNYQLEIITKHGLRVPLEASTRLLHRDGKIVGMQGIARDIGDRKRTEAALIQLNDALEEQAKRIAHELHDESGQLLVSVHMALNEVARNLPPEAKKSVQSVKVLLDQIEVQLRRLSHELRPTILDDLGLVPAIEFLAQGISERGQLPVTVKGSSGGRLPVQAEIVLYRVVQEALNNVVRHAFAKTARVSIHRDGNAVHCSVLDDGVGFDLKSIGGQKAKRGLGLVGMRERLATVKGAYIIKTSPGQGTEIIATVPMESQDAPSNHSR